MHVEQARPSLGFDCDVRLTRAVAYYMRTLGFEWCARYVSLGNEGGQDLDIEETSMIVEDIGLNLLVVQHVEYPDWHPTPSLGTQFGRTAAVNARASGYLPGAHIFVDDEGMNVATTPDAAIGFTANWGAQILEAANAAGGYFGFGVPLNPAQLYSIPHITSYWAAPRKPGTREVATRGYAIEQTWPEITIDGFTFDIDILHADKLGEMPWWQTRG